MRIQVVLDATFATKMWYTTEKIKCGIQKYQRFRHKIYYINSGVRKRKSFFL